MQVFRIHSVRISERRPVAVPVLTSDHCRSKMAVFARIVLRTSTFYRCRIYPPYRCAGSRCLQIPSRRRMGICTALT